MYPILFSYGPLHLYSFGLMLAIAFAVTIPMLARDAGRHLAPLARISREDAFRKTFDLFLGVILASLVGARLFYVLENHAEFQGRWLHAFNVAEGGMVFYGGLFGAIPAAYLWMKKEGWPIALFFDLAAPYILLGHVFGRIGCYLNGCCYGIVDHTHGVVFPNGEDQLPHLPTQLWELYGDLALFLLIWWGRRWTLKYPWLTLSIYGLTYGILRFSIEFWRRDWDKRYLVVFNSVSQAISGIMVCLSVLAIIMIAVKASKRAKPS